MSKRRLLSLLATAAVASGLGIAMGSTLRFQVVPVSQSPLFKPQQDFPPLAQWPPEVPSAAEYADDFDPNWQDEAPAPRLVYNDSPDPSTEAVDSYNGTEDVYDYGESELEATLTPEGLTSLDSGVVINEDGTVTGEVFEEEALPPLVSTSTDELDGQPNGIDAPQTSDDTPLTEPTPWFNKQPLSESQFTDEPVIISPDELSPSPDVRSD